MKIMTARLFLIMAFLLLNYPNLSGQNTTGTPSQQVGMTMGDEQDSNIPYFSEADGMHSTLTLNNNQSTERAVEVAIFSHKGKALPVSSVTLKPQSITELKITLNDLSK